MTEMIRIINGTLLGCASLFLLGHAYCIYHRTPQPAAITRLATGAGLLYVSGLLFTYLGMLHLQADWRPAAAVGAALAIGICHCQVHRRVERQIGCPLPARFTLLPAAGYAALLLTFIV